MKPDRALRAAKDRIVTLEKSLEMQTRDNQYLRREVEALRTARDAALRSAIVLWRPPSKP